MKRSWHISVMVPASRRKPSHRRGYVLNALAFSTLLSSQGADAHLRRALACLQGNYSTLPDEPPHVNQVPENFSAQVGFPSTRHTLPDRLPCSCGTRQFMVARGFPASWSAVWRSVSRRATRTLETVGALVKSNGEVGAHYRRPPAAPRCMCPGRSK